MVLHARWLVAARYSGRFDFEPVIKRLGGPDGFEEASAAVLAEAGLSPRLIEELGSQRGAVRMDWECIRLGDSNYPSQLLALMKAPPVIWWRGRSSACLSVKGLAVVGARACTAYGKSMACRLGRLEAASGGVLISGAARGIDRAAHQGALEMGRTIAVLGGGLGHSMSRHQQVLMNEIVENDGMVISEFPPNQSPTKWSFPQRNRVVAALSRSVVVVEAHRRSGALITAGFARDLSREVYAVPGRLDSPSSEGCHALIEEGARIVVRLSDPIWDRPLGQLEKLPLLLRLLRSGPLCVSDLVERSGMSPTEIRRCIGRYELAGLIQRNSGARIALS